MPFYNIVNMKTRPVVRRIKKLLGIHGGYESVAVLLGCTSRYVRMMELGMEPGKRLYRDICLEAEVLDR